MYVLERLTFQGMDCCPQYRWIQMALCEKRPPLDKVMAGQKRPSDWRVVFMPCTMREVMKNFPKTA